MLRVPDGYDIPRFRKGDVVAKYAKYAKRKRIWHILKVRWDNEGKPIYKIRYYNSLALFTGKWVKETDLEH